MGILKPTSSTKNLSSVSVPRLVEQHQGSDPKANSELLKATQSDFSNDLRPNRIRPRVNHSHPSMRGPGLSVPGFNHSRRAGFLRKNKKAA